VTRQILETHTRRKRRARSGFTLLEVMLAVGIMAIALGAVFSAQAGSVKMAQRARKLNQATLLARCKMGEAEESLAKLGLPTVPQTESDECCKDAPIEGYQCRTEIVPIVLPDSMFSDEENEDGASLTDGAAAKDGKASENKSSGSSSSQSGGFKDLLNKATSLFGGNKDGTDSQPSLDKNDKSKDLKSTTDPKDPAEAAQNALKDGASKDPTKQDPTSLLSGDPSQLLAGDQSGEAPIDGLAAMAMQIVYPVLKVPFESQIRRITVKVTWSEGSAEKDFELTQYFVAEQPTQLSTDPNNANATGTGTGTTTGSSTTTGSTSGTSTLGGTQ